MASGHTGGLVLWCTNLTSSRNLAPPFTVHHCEICLHKSLSFSQSEVNLLVGDKGLAEQLDCVPRRFTLATINDGLGATQ